MKLEFKEYHKQRVKAMRKSYNPLIIKEKSFTKQNISVMSFNDGFYAGFKLAGGKIGKAKYPEDYI